MGDTGRDTGFIRLRIDVSYDGTEFSGWAAQPGLRTVEGTLAEGLGRVLRLPGPPRMTVAGRTDAGVHARGQVVHADIPADGWEGGAWLRRGGARADELTPDALA